MELLIDVGNSRIKWAYAHKGRLECHGSAEHKENIPAEAASAWLNASPPEHVIAANVAGAGYAKQLSAWVQRQWQLRVDFITLDPFRLELAYAEPERLGVDRWLALVAARQLVSGTVAVIDAGTAVTLDMVSAEGKHLGGIILPGLELMSMSLQQKASGIRAGVGGSVFDQSSLLGKDTRSCIEKGSLYAVTGAVEHVLKRFRAQVGEVQSVIICGGNGEQLKAELNIRCQFIPDLILQGMQIVKGGC